VDESSILTETKLNSYHEKNNGSPLKYLSWFKFWVSPSELQPREIGLKKLFLS